MNDTQTTETTTPELTPEEQQDMRDNATIFVLAGSMVKMYKAIVTKDTRRINNIVINLGNVLRQDPTFLPRFETLQKEVMDNYNETHPGKNDIHPELELITP